jgi:hypothetical protein
MLGAARMVSRLFGAKNMWSTLRPCLYGFPGADCSQANPNCTYMLGGQVRPVVNSYLPGWKGRTWTFAAANTVPTVNNEVACAVGPNPYGSSLAVTFSATTRACTTSDQTVKVTVTPAPGYTCNRTLVVGKYTGKVEGAVGP